MKLHGSEVIEDFENNRIIEEDEFQESEQKFIKKVKDLSSSAKESVKHKVDSAK